jgi:TIR domain
VAKIYISYNHQDSVIASEISRRLLERGHDVFRAEESLTPGQDWESALSEALQSSEVFVSLLTENSINSQYVLTELGAARAYQRTSKRMLVIPVLLDKIEIPPVIRHIQVIFAPKRDIDEIVDQIERAITTFIGQRAAVEEKEVEVKKRIEANAAVYIDEAIRSLAEREAKNRLSGNIWYYLGYITLAAGVGYGVYSVAQYASSNDQHWIRFAYLGLKSIIIIGLLIACSKYAFTLGKSYMSEALKSADRIHAISFGRFYLRAFSEKADWAELKEVFQHWNISNSSAFTELDVNHFDPKFLEAVVEVAKALAAKVEAKK